MSRSARVLLCFGMLAGCDPGGGEESRSDKILGLEGDAANGEAVFAANQCSTAACHGPDGLSGTAPNLDEEVPELSDEQIVQTLLEGKGTMPTQEALADQELADLVAWLTTTF